LKEDFFERELENWVEVGQGGPRAVILKGIVIWWGGGTVGSVGCPSKLTDLSTIRGGGGGGGGSPSKVETLRVSAHLGTSTGPAIKGPVEDDRQKFIQCFKESESEKKMSWGGGGERDGCGRKAAAPQEGAGGGIGFGLGKVTHNGINVRWKGGKDPYFDLMPGGVVC